MSEHGQTDWDELLDVKGLAWAAKRSRAYIEDMKTCGFIMPGERATLRMYMTFHANNPGFRRSMAAKVRFARRAKG